MVYVHPFDRIRADSGGFGQEEMLGGSNRSLAALCCFSTSWRRVLRNRRRTVKRPASFVSSASFHEPLPRHSEYTYTAAPAPLHPVEERRPFPRPSLPPSLARPLEKMVSSLENLRIVGRARAEDNGTIGGWRRSAQNDKRESRRWWSGTRYRHAPDKVTLAEREEGRESRSTRTFIFGQLAAFLDRRSIRFETRPRVA